MIRYEPDADGAVWVAGPVFAKLTTGCFNHPHLVAAEVHVDDYWSDLDRIARATRSYDRGDRVMVIVDVATALPVAYRASWSPPEHRPFKVPRSAALDTARRHAQVALGRADLVLGGERRYLTYPGSDPPHPVYAFAFRLDGVGETAVWVWVDGIEGKVMQTSELARLVRERVTSDG